MSRGRKNHHFKTFGANTNPTSEALESKFLILIQNNIQVGYDFHLALHGWMKVSVVKHKISEKTLLSESDFRLMYRNQELKNHDDLDVFYKLIKEYGIKQNCSIRLVTRSANMYCITEMDILDQNSKAFKRFNETVWEVQGTFNMGITPKLTDFGTQGTYMLEGLSRKNVAIFKPVDEEAFAYYLFLSSPNNPRGYVGKLKSPGLRKGILSGEGVDREVAAYLIDEASGNYHGVPITSYVEIRHPNFRWCEGQQFKQIQDQQVPVKQGSFQLFVKHDDDSGNYGSTLFPLREAHKLAILDIRILNCDRNEENILVRKKKVHQSQQSTRQAYDFELIPIDHGYSFPDQFAICRDEVVWFHWSQMKQPLTPEELKFIDSIDPEKDINMLRTKLKFREVCLRNVRISGMFLKMAAKAGLTIHQMAELLYREDADEMSAVEKAIKQAEDNYDNGNRVPTKITDLKHSFFKNNLIQKSLEFTTLKLTPSYSLNEDYGTSGNDKRHKSVPKTNPNKRKDSSAWAEDFYPHVQWFLGLIIEQQSKDPSSPQKKSHRMRYQSEDYE